MKKSKFLALLLALAMTFTLTACGNKDSAGDTSAPPC